MVVGTELEVLYLLRYKLQANHPIVRIQEEIIQKHCSHFNVSASRLVYFISLILWMVVHFISYSLLYHAMLHYTKKHNVVMHDDACAFAFQISFCNISQLTWPSCSVFTFNNFASQCFGFVFYCHMVGFLTSVKCLKMLELLFTFNIF